MDEDDTKEVESTLATQLQVHATKLFSKCTFIGWRNLQFSYCAYVLVQNNIKKILFEAITSEQVLMTNDKIAVHALE